VFVAYITIVLSRSAQPCRRHALVIAHSESPTGSAILRQATAVKQNQVPESDLTKQEMALPTGACFVAGQIMPCRGDACPESFSLPPFAKSIGETIAPNRVRSTGSRCIAQASSLSYMRDRSQAWLSLLI
jgi:hypothetical protein